MSEPLTEYESRAVRLIAEWKARTPSRVSRALKVVRWPVGKVMGKVVPEPGVHKICDKVEALLERRNGLEEIARKAGVRDVEELAHRSLEECDQLAREVSARAQREAILEGATAGVAGIAGEAMNTPVLIGAAIRAIRRIGHCYGYRLDTELDRQYVLGILELSTVEDPEERKRIRERLYRLMHKMDEGEPPIGFEGIKKELVEDLVFEVVPIVGGLVSVFDDYAYMRRVDFAARRVFQERWLRRRGKVTVIAPAEVSRRARSLWVAWEATNELIYLGSFAVGFVVSVPFAAVGTLATRLPGPVVRGMEDGSRHAIASADSVLEHLRSRDRPPGSLSDLSASLPA
ncbi:MAG: EcsC family protein [Planctomycetaceae bacterium]|nr:EcsC family protein [Planctomycetaceae bacterium]